MSFKEPGFRVAWVVYFTDLTRADAKIIPLGALSEVQMPHVHGLALKAREQLLPSEIALISPLLQEQLAKPFEFLRAEFDLAWDEAVAGKDALDFLAGRHTSSLSVLAPKDCSERKWALNRLFAPRQDAVEGKLSAAVDNEFDAMGKQYGESIKSDRKVIESSRQAA